MKCINKEKFMKSTIKLIGILILFLSIIFIGQVISNNWSTIKDGPSYFNVYQFVFGIFLLQIFWLYQAATFRLIYSKIDKKPDYSSICRIIFLNNLLAYIPGKIIGLIGVANFSSKLNLSPPSILWTIILFQVYSFISAGLVFLFLINFSNIENYNTLLMFCSIFLGIFFLLFSNILKTYLISFLGYFKKIPKIKIKDVSFYDNIVSILLYTQSWIIAGLSLWLILKSFSLNWISIPEVVIIFVISYVIGQITIIVPAGLGILEASLILLLSRIVPVDIVVYSVASFRIIIIATNLFSHIILTRLSLNYKKLI